MNEETDGGRHGVVVNRRASGIAQVITQLSRKVLEKRGADDLHAAQWSALRYFARAGRRTSTIMGLAGFLGNTTGSASRTVKSLTERGLVAGAPSRYDARSVNFTLTKAGEHTLTTDPLNDVSDALGVLTEDELTQLGSLLEKVERALEEARR